MFSIFVALGHQQHIDESVSALSFIENVEVFKEERTMGSTLYLV